MPALTQCNFWLQKHFNKIKHRLVLQGQIYSFGLQVFCEHIHHRLSSSQQMTGSWPVSLLLHHCKVRYILQPSLLTASLSSQPMQLLLALLGATDGLWLPGSFAGVHSPATLPLMPGLDALASEWSWGYCCSVELWLGVGGEGSKWYLLDWGYCRLHWFFGLVSAFSLHCLR